MPDCTAFNGTKRIASGELKEVAAKAKEVWDRDKWAQVLIFDDGTSELIEVDFRANSESVPPRPGRPRLGVVPREVTLLPRHWDWLASQPGGASVALRKLVEQARRANQEMDRRRRAQESVYRFVTAMAGNEPGYEEAIRALFAGQPERFDEMVDSWPEDVREHAKQLAAAAFAA